MIRLPAQWILPALAAVIIVGGTACRSQRAPAAPAERNGGKPAVLIVISDSPAEFEPRAATVKVGDAVEWRNTGAISHSVDFLGPAAVESGAPDVGLIPPHGSYIRTFTAPGTYSYACRFHIINGMSGRIIVIPDDHARASGPTGSDQ